MKTCARAPHDSTSCRGRRSTRMRGRPGRRRPLWFKVGHSTGSPASRRLTKLTPLTTRLRHIKTRNKRFASIIHTSMKFEPLFRPSGPDFSEELHAEMLPSPARRCKARVGAHRRSCSHRARSNCERNRRRGSAQVPPAAGTRFHLSRSTPMCGTRASSAKRRRCPVTAPVRARRGPSTRVRTAQLAQAMPRKGLPARICSTALPHPMESSSAAMAEVATPAG